MKKPLVLLASASFALVLSGCGGTVSDGNQAANTGSPQTIEAAHTSSAKAADPSSSRSFFKDGVLTTSDLKIEITDHKIIPSGKKGNEYGSKPVIAFWYNITNLTDKDVDRDVSPMDFIFAITAYQDNNPNAENKLEVGGLPDDKFLDSQTENIKKGRTVTNAIAFELDDTKTPVDLVASNDLGMTEIGKITYKLK
ncbi:DUF5067 domain-containing protein [Arthrobacter sp.]|uniref:DUF5067 domain-containing protein n=1 Tax=Arthrobacter sp. TaxID=1667 RepID=UPI003A95A28E